MGAPFKIQRPIRVHTTFPEDIYGRVLLKLYSPVEGKVPKGAMQTYLLGLIQVDLDADDKRRKDQAMIDVLDKQVPNEQR